MKRLLYIFLIVFVLGSILQCSSNCYAANSSFKYENEYNKSISYMEENYNPGVSYTSGEWSVLALARSGKLSEDKKGKYINALKEYVKSNNSDKISNARATDNARVIIALSSLNENPMDFNGYNLINPLNDYDFVTYQGISGPVWALIAMNSKNYSFSGENVSREKLIEFILDYQSDSGLFTFDKKSEDVDVTAMCLQALSPYKGNSDVNNAIEKALNALSQKQSSKGAFGYGSSINCESTSQVIIALCALGINPETDSRFIKNNKSMVDGLLLFYRDDGSFSHMENGSVNAMATEQGVLALISLRRQYYKLDYIYNMVNVDVYDNYDNLEEEKHVENSANNKNTYGYTGNDSGKYLTADVNNDINNVAGTALSNENNNNDLSSKTSAKTSDEKNVPFVLITISVIAFIYANTRKYHNENI